MFIDHWEALLRLTGLQEISVAVIVNYTSIQAAAMEVPTLTLVDLTPLTLSLLQITVLIPNAVQARWRFSLCETAQISCEAHVFIDTPMYL